MRNTRPAGLRPLNGMVARIGRLVSEHPSAHSYPPASVADFPSPEGLAAWMGEAGFRDVSYRLLTGGIVAIHVGVK